MRGVGGGGGLGQAHRQRQETQNQRERHTHTEGDREKKERQTDRLTDRQRTHGQTERQQTNRLTQTTGRPTIRERVIECRFSKVQELLPLASSCPSTIRNRHSRPPPLPSPVPPTLTPSSIFIHPHQSFPPCSQFQCWQILHLRILQLRKKAVITFDDGIINPSKKLGMQDRADNILEK